jgi:hypothetical protein
MRTAYGTASDREHQNATFGLAQGFPLEPWASRRALFVAIDRTSKFAFAQLHEKANRTTATGKKRAEMESLHRPHWSPSFRAAKKFCAGQFVRARSRLRWRPPRCERRYRAGLNAVKRGRWGDRLISRRGHKPFCASGSRDGSHLHALYFSGARSSNRSAAGILRHSAIRTVKWY